MKAMDYLLFRDFFYFFLNFKSIYLIKIDFINRVGDVAKSGASDQITNVDPGRGRCGSTWRIRSRD